MMHTATIVRPIPIWTSLVDMSQIAAQAMPAITMIATT